MKNNDDGPLFGETVAEYIKRRDASKPAINPAALAEAGGQAVGLNEAGSVGSSEEASDPESLGPKDGESAQ
jgi:hypothetical protein